MTRGAREGLELVCLELLWSWILGFGAFTDPRF